MSDRETFMPDSTDLRERTISRVRELSDAKLAVLQEFIDELASEPDVYSLSDDELEVLNAASADVKAGNYATEAEVAHAFRRVAK
jgi:hypothetical protein